MKALKPSQLRTNLPLSRIRKTASKMVSPCDFQPRVLRTLRLALKLGHPEYNIYLAGEEGLGRTYMARDFLKKYASSLPCPDDLVYVCNFEDEDRPRLLHLRAGEGKSLRLRLAAIIKNIIRQVPNAFEHDVYTRKHDALLQAFAVRREAMFEKMAEVAQGKGFNLTIEDSGALALYPLVEGKVLTPEEYEKLPTPMRKEMKEKSAKLMDEVMGMSRQVDKEEQRLKQEEKELARATVEAVLREEFADTEKIWADNAQATEYFSCLRKDILENLEKFRPVGREEENPQESASNENFFQRYAVNLFVDNSGTQGAPIVMESNPGYFNLLGGIERQTEWGTYFTDFSLIKAGSLHRANGGFLILRADDLLQHPAAWEGLVRCLRLCQAGVEDPPDRYETVRIKTIEPHPLRLDVRVILVGDDETHETLFWHDERFRKLFKLKAHAQQFCQRTPESIDLYTHALRQLAREASVRPLSPAALAELVDYGSYMAQDQEKLSLHFPVHKEIVCEANCMADNGQKYIDRKDILATLAEREYRNNLYEQEFLDEYDRQIIKVKTSGEAVGMVNGLSVSQVGDFVLGLPHQISANVGVGHGGIIDLEREAELGGPIHTKGMMILKSYLMRMFAQYKPLVLGASICFEQSYVQVDGDSASGAELVALLSALSGVPVKLSLAFTGAVSQSGEIMAVGEVSRKIEGFFKVCNQRGLNGEQGVLIPADNAVHLMLSEEVVQAVRDGLFQIYTVSSIAEALRLLTGVKAGKELSRGGFSPDSIFARVDERLQELAALAEMQMQMPRGKKRK